MRLSWKGTGRVLHGDFVLDWHYNGSESVYSLYSLNKRTDQATLLFLRIPDNAWQASMPTDFYNDVQR
jgi:hypothetical protein